MSAAPSLLDELRVQYEASRKSHDRHDDVPDFQEIDRRMRTAFRWLEKAIAYLDELKPPIAHRFDLGHGLAFESPRLGRAYVGQHERRIVGFPVLDEINVYYELRTDPVTIDAAATDAGAAARALDAAGLQYTHRAVEDHAGVVRRCRISVAPAIPAAASLHADYQRGVVTASLVNVDRFDRVSLDFPATAIDEAVMEDLVRLVLGRGDAFLHRAPLTGIHGLPQKST